MNLFLLTTTVTVVTVKIVLNRIFSEAFSGGILETKAKSSKKTETSLKSITAADFSDSCCCYSALFSLLYYMVSQLPLLG